MAAKTFGISQEHIVLGNGAAELLEEQILIKDLTGKIANGRQYVRIAVRSRRENDQLAETLKIKIGIAAEYEKY